MSKNKIKMTEAEFQHVLSLEYSEGKHDVLRRIKNATKNAFFVLLLVLVVVLLIFAILYMWKALF